MEKRDSQISLRLPADLRAELERLAGAQDRTLSAYAVRVLREHVEGSKSASTGKSKKS